jgi:hypothetical protein
MTEVPRFSAAFDWIQAYCSDLVPHQQTKLIKTFRPMIEASEFHAFHLKAWLQKATFSSGYWIKSGSCTTPTHQANQSFPIMTYRFLLISPIRVWLPVPSHTLGYRVVQSDLYTISCHWLSFSSCIVFFSIAFLCQRDVLLLLWATGFDTINSSPSSLDLTKYQLLSSIDG